MRQFLRALAKQRMRKAKMTKVNTRMRYPDGKPGHWREVLGIGKIAAIRTIVKPKRRPDQ